MNIFSKIWNGVSNKNKKSNSDIFISLIDAGVNSWLRRSEAYANPTSSTMSKETLNAASGIRDLMHNIALERVKTDRQKIESASYSEIVKMTKSVLEDTVKSGNIKI